jgi:hypothetical protein
VIDASPGTEAELGICEGGWAVVFWWIPNSEGLDRKSVLQFEQGTWRIVTGVCHGADLPASVQLLACQTG